MAQYIKVYLIYGGSIYLCEGFSLKNFALNLEHKNKIVRSTKNYVKSCG